MRRLTVPLCAILLCAGCSDPPQKEIDRAQGAIDAARAAGAARYASDEFTAATTSLQRAHEAVAQRDYRLALSRALDASERAQQAAREAADGKARARSEAEATMAAMAAATKQLRTAIKTAEAARAPAPVLAEARKAAASADTSLQKARALLAAEQYLEAKDALKGLSERIGKQTRAVTEAQKGRPARRRS